ncbi:MAG: LysM peptidoglycan-binding domain-containing protein [Acidobacteria bacterium]|nr:LysM peptidoglycan-binding domain-containing protein [Acidobacteriota bacterium]
MPVDPVLDLLARADRHFETGRYELTLGHLARAKVAFNTSLELLLESPHGAQADVRVKEHFNRLVDRIAALELAALATGDGFTEQTAEPASIDELLAISTFDTTAPTAATAEHVQADLQQTAHDIPIPLNERVLRYVELFQGRLREFLASGLQRGAQYLPMIQSVFRAEGLPLDLAYVPLIESAFKPTALSRAKAKGVWQFMSATGRENGLKQDWFIDERSDPAKSTVAAAKYFKTLYRTFDDWHLAMASYNGGPGRMQRAIRRSGRDDFWTLTSTSQFLPRETRDYVPMILAAVIIAKNPTQYGFDVIPTLEAAVETVEVPAAVDLRRVAEWAGRSADEIQQLNPELRRWTTPIRVGTYKLKVPAGTADVVRERIQDAGPNSFNALQWHVVKRGETLSAIAKKLRVNRTDLAEANYLKAASKVTSGQKLLIPRMPSVALLARASVSGAVQTASAEPAATLDSATEVAPAVVHRVKPGETLFALARRYQTTIEQLKRLNRLVGSTLRVGARLVISSPLGSNAQQQ